MASKGDHVQDAQIKEAIADFGLQGRKLYLPQMPYGGSYLLAAAIRQHNRPDGVGAAGLTDQETRILELIAAGLSNKVIAKALEIAEGTVKVHVKHILRKLGMRSRVEAAVWAAEHLVRAKIA